MAERSLGRTLLSVALLIATALGLFNVYSDNADVKALAEKAACNDRPCAAHQTRETRSPIGQSFTYQIALTEKSKSERRASVDVECRRSLYLLGEYSCSAQGSPP